jgi:hypothetical protein
VLPSIGPQAFEATNSDNVVFVSIMSAASSESHEAEPRVRRSQARSRFRPRTLAITISDSGSDDGKSKAKDSSIKGEDKGQAMNKVIKSKKEFVGNFEAWRARVRRNMDEKKACSAANASSSALQDK